jgi:hypothetical protein
LLGDAAAGACCVDIDEYGAQGGEDGDAPGCGYCFVEGWDAVVVGTGEAVVASLRGKPWGRAGESVAQGGAADVAAMKGCAGCEGEQEREGEKEEGAAGDQG